MPRTLTYICNLKELKMNLLTLIIALIQMANSTLQDNAWTNALLDKMVGIESWFFGFAWIVWGIFIAIVIIVAVVMILNKKKLDLDLSVGCGCSMIGIVFAIMLLIWPLAEWFSLFLVTGMADNFGPEGVINTGKFAIYLILYLFLGVG